MATLNAVTAAPKEMTLSERLNATFRHMDGQCDRLENMLSRVNGVPPQGQASAQKDPTSQLGLAETVARLENLSQRLGNLVDGIEHIA